MTAGGPENRHATLRAGVPPSQATLASGNRTEAPTHTQPSPRSTARHGTQRVRHPLGRAKAPGQQAQARTPHHRAGTAPRGSHREHGDARKRIEGAFPPTGVSIRSAQARLKGKPKGTAMYKMTGCACNAASRAGQGMSYQLSKPFSAVVPIFKTFLPPGTRPTKRKAKHRRSTPHHEGATHHQNVPCRPNATGTAGTDPKRPPRPNTSNSRTDRPLGGEDDGQPAKPTKHSAGNDASTSHADTPQPDEPRQNAPDGKQMVWGTAYSDHTRPARPIRATAQPRTSRPLAATTTANQHNGPGTPRPQHNDRHIGQAGHNKPQN